MRKLLMSLYDLKAEEYLVPFLVPTLGSAYRMLQDEVKRGRDDSPLSTHPGDFDLIQLGVFDTESGDIDTDSRSRVVNVASLLTE